VALRARVSGDRHLSEDLRAANFARARLDQVAAWRESPRLSLLAEGSEYWPVASELIRKATGPRVHDARVAALCLAHGVRELWSADRDFTRFSSLVVRNPLVPDA